MLGCSKRGLRNAWGSLPILLLGASLQAQEWGLDREKEAKPETYPEKAMEVQDFLEKHFWLDQRDLYAAELDGEKLEMIWGAGVTFSSLVGGARHDQGVKRMMRKNFEALESFWDEGVEIPGYEPLPTAGGGNDKYYDDNAWMVLALEEAYRVSGRTTYLRRARDTLDFVLSGEDEEAGGGIWWHQNHKGGSKNTCANGPAALGCYVIARHLEGEEAKHYLEAGSRIIDWTTENLYDENDGRFWDALNVETGKINRVGEGI
jgi:hypothetical protein